MQDSEPMKPYWWEIVAGALLMLFLLLFFAGMILLAGWHMKAEAAWQQEWQSGTEAR